MYSHPGKELKIHLDNVKKLGLKIFDERETVWSNDLEIRKTLEIILQTHDFGKATSYFQDYIVDTENEKWKKNKNRELKSHSLLSAYFSYYLVLNNVKNLKLGLMAYMIVLRHHGNIDSFSENNFLIGFRDDGNFLKQLESFNYGYFDLLNFKDDFIIKIRAFEDWEFGNELNAIINDLEVKDFLLLNYMFSILISADKGDAIYYSNKRDFDELIEQKFSLKIIQSNLVDEYKNKKFGNSKTNINDVREKIYKEVEANLLREDLIKNKIFSINVPTGMGKTLTAFNGALKLREKLGGKHKIIYTLPFTSIIEQNYDVIEEILKTSNNKILLKHHYLAQKEYRVSEENYSYDISEYLIENWDSEIIVTTFVQLLESIFSNKNRKLKKVHNIVNSIIILDEVQSIPYKYWELINKIFIELSKFYNTYIILVTATLPLLFGESKGEIVELAKSKNDYFSALNRINLSIVREKMNLDEFFEFLSDDIDESQLNSYLVIMNTIKSSIKTYNYLKNIYEDNYEMIYLSTNIIPKERLLRINRIKNSKKVIIVSTQMVEAGVDIDIERVYRDMASFDSINQSCGRCNRNNVDQKKGQVKLVRLVDDGNKDMDYSKYIYSDILLKSTWDILSDEDFIEENDIFRLANKYYEKIDNCKSNDTSNKIIQNIKNLDYEKAFGKDGFKLIDNDFKTVDLFICLDQVAIDLWKNYEKLSELDLYERKEEFDKIKSKFLSYVISVPETSYSGDIGFNVIYEDMVDIYYDGEIGFIRDDKQKDYIF